MKTEQLRTAKSKAHDCIYKKKYPHKMQKVSRWEQCTNNHQDQCTSAFLWEEAQRNNGVSHGPEIGGSLKMSEGTSLEIKTGPFENRK